MKEQKYRKVYIDVYALMRQNGMLIPKVFIWEDGAKYKIDRVLHAVPAASTKVGGRGISYTVRIGNLEQYLFLEDEENRWFMEVPVYAQ